MWNVAVIAVSLAYLLFAIHQANKRSDEYKEMYLKVLKDDIALMKETKAYIAAVKAVVSYDEYAEIDAIFKATYPKKSTPTTG